MHKKLVELLEEEHSKTQSIRIAEWIGNSKTRFASLVEIVCGEEKKLSQRGAWAITFCAASHRDLVIPYLKDLLKNLARPGLHDAVKRNTLKVAAESPIPDDFAGLAVDTAFHILCAPEESIAAKAHSMSILETFCLKEPALSDEIRTAIQSQLPYETSPGFRSKARRVLLTLDKLEKS